MGDWFINPLGTAGPPAWAGSIVLGCLDTTRPARLAGDYVCIRCAAPLVACYQCGLPALCGDIHCEGCQPAG